MSNEFAIAAVTATLRNLLDRGIDQSVKPITFTARPLDKARDPNDDFDQLNLFLYQAQINGAWRNRDMPGQLKPGETGPPPLPLTLFYLLTAYAGDQRDETQSHSLLGRAMRVLHDHPVLSAADIAGNFPASDLHQQIERVRITFEPLAIEEVSKLWAAFQTNYRTSAAYQVSLVLIESKRPAKAPLPVLKRGEDDRGVASQPDLIPPFPALTELLPPPKQASARLGEVVTLRGHHLDKGTLTVRFANPHLTDPVPVQVVTATPQEVDVRLLDTPDDADARKKWVAGFYAVSLELKEGERVRTTNELPLTVAPVITSALPMTVSLGVPFTLECSPQVRPAQRAALLLGDREVAASPHPTQIGTLEFTVKSAPLGKHFARLRIDGVDSLLIDHSVEPPKFDEDSMVEIQ